MSGLHKSQHIAGVEFAAAVVASVTIIVMTRVSYAKCCSSCSLRVKET